MEDGGKPEIRLCARLRRVGSGESSAISRSDSESLAPELISNRKGKEKAENAGIRDAGWERRKGGGGKARIGIQQFGFRRAFA